MALIRKPYPSDVNDEEWALVVPYLTLMTEAAPQRQHSLRELFNGLRYVIRYGIAWRAMPNDLPPWFTVYQQSHRWLVAGVFDTLAQDLRAVLRIAAGRGSEPTTAIIDSSRRFKRLTRSNVSSPSLSPFLPPASGLSCGDVGEDRGGSTRVRSPPTFAQFGPALQSTQAVDVRQ